MRQQHRHRNCNRPSLCTPPCCAHFVCRSSATHTHKSNSHTVHIVLSCLPWRSAGGQQHRHCPHPLSFVPSVSIPTQRTRIRNTPTPVSPDCAMPTSLLATQRGSALPSHRSFISFFRMPSIAAASSTATTAALLLLSLPMADAHDHAVDGIPDDAATSPDPIDSTLWAHIFVMMLAFGVLFPLGMVLGVSTAASCAPILLGV